MSGAMPLLLPNVFMVQKRKILLFWCGKNFIRMDRLKFFPMRLSYAGFKVT
jgi:hypothetical protein